MKTFKIIFSDFSMIFLPAKDSSEADIKAVQIANASEPGKERHVIEVSEVAR